MLEWNKGRSALVFPANCDSLTAYRLRKLYRFAIASKFHCNVLTIGRMGVIPLERWARSRRACVRRSSDFYTGMSSAPPPQVAGLGRMPIDTPGEQGAYLATMRACNLIKTRPQASHDYPRALKQVGMDVCGGAVRNLKER